MNSIDKRLFVRLFFAFIGATVIGTLSHECGHYLVAKYLGYDAGINYGFTWWEKLNPNQVTDSSDSFWITFGGTLETSLTGTIGVFLLFLFRKKFENISSLSFGKWFLIFISLFWLRPTANFFTWVGSYFLNGQFSQRGDEIKLARHFQLPDWSIITLTAIVGAIVLTIIIFKFIPIKQRLTFIVSGLTGGIAGYVLWLILLGKYIMP